MKTDSCKNSLVKSFLALLNAKSSSFLFLIFLLSSSLFAQNPIVAENANQGNPASEWDIVGSGDLSIQGFATDISVNTGETIDFKIDCKAPQTNFTIKIYRLGYYNNDGGRLIADLGSFAGTIQPSPLYEVATGKTDCSNWSVSASWNTTGAVSGLFLAKLTRADNNGSSHIAFIIRNDGVPSDMLFKTSDTTWQAYNGYGGNSLYVNNSGISVPGSNRATKVSYNRPFYTRGGGGGSSSSEDWLFDSEYPMIRWLERNGYNVSYTTDVDMDRNTTAITPSLHKVLLSVGHDEYWSAAERTKFENARDAGVHLGFFSGNEVYWKTRWEDNHRTLVCYKEGGSGENQCGFKCDTSTPIWTGLWRDGSPTNYPGSDAGRPENALTGQISWGDATGSIVVPDTYKNLRFWRNTSIASLGEGQSVTLPYGTLGYEFDFEQFHAFYPPGRVTLSSTFLVGKNHKLSMYRHTSGALVFGAGTVQWSWGLDEHHDRGNEPPSQDMQQATLNVFTDMGVLPATVQPELIISNPINVNPPVSVIGSPVNNSILPQNSQVTISGTASDTDGAVAGVEVSVDGGTTWNVAVGMTNWSYSWIPTAQGLVTIQTRAFDDNGNIETPGEGITITIGEPEPIVCPCSIFASTSTPTLHENDGQPIEVGMKFKSAVDGFITGIRFYKAIGDNGTHTGNLWDSNQTLLASVLFTGESSSGWQEATFTSPVAINANQTYVISYHSSENRYTSTSAYFTSAVITGNLTALADGTDGPNGVYVYTQNSAFPSQTYQASNYWVDVVFNTEATDTTSPSITQVQPVEEATLVSYTTTVSATFSENINATTLNEASFELRDSENNLVPATVVYTNGTKTATLTPTNPLNFSTAYTAILKSGIEDLSGNAIQTDYSWTFTTAAELQPNPIPTPDGPGGPILIISSASNPFSRYTIEILRAEGINQFKALDISQVNETVLAQYDVAILGEMAIDASQSSMFNDWVTSGKTLIAFKPDEDLFPLMGIASVSGTLSDQYLLINTASGPGVGLVDQTIQYHSNADLYTLNDAFAIATLYSSANTATSNPAVTFKNVGSGKAIAFAYDLAKSIVYTRQGNPSWAGQQRDDQNDGNIRSNDLFQPDWIDFDKIAIPQADEQQRLLSNIILQSNLDIMPLPRFWFLPRKLKAAVVMTGDDHGNNGTAGRFDYYLSFGNNTAEDVLNWRAIRGTSYIYPSTPLSNTDAAAYEAQGFEIALHVNSGCNVYTYSGLQSSFANQMTDFNNKYTNLSAAKTHRTHCISWSDWASKPKVEIANGIRLNTDYYYWPASWVQNRPGMFTGSGMPMRFADLDGTIIDNYQLTTQMPDESGLNVANFINTLLDNAQGSLGYYGVFCANMHTDNNNPGDQSVVGSNAIIASAIAHNVPVISAKQMLTWLDSRNASTYSNLAFANNILSFTMAQASGAHQLQGMLPVSSSNGELISLQLEGSPVAYTTEVIKGINYAFFEAASGNYTATYGVDILSPIISNVVATPNNDGTATITWNTDEPSTSVVYLGTHEENLALTHSSSALVTNHSVILTNLNLNTTYYFRVTSVDAVDNSTIQPIAPENMNFVMPAGPCALDTSSADFNMGTIANTMVIDTEGGGLSLNAIINEAFNGSSFPSGWSSFAWTGGTTSVSGGAVTVDGARFNTVSPTTVFGPGSSMEFVATFGSASFQHVGFGAGTDATDSNGIYTGQSAWAMFSTGNQSSVLRARTSLNGVTSVDVNLPGSLLDSPHLYKIEWEASAVKYYVDGTLVHTEAITIGGTMRPAISDYNAGGPSVSVDWIRVSPFASSGTFISRIFDAGNIIQWQNASWNASVPSGTTLQISQRQSNSSEDILNATWFTIPSSGTFVGGISQYIQYKADFATTNNTVSPVLKEISFVCGDAPLSAPVIMMQPTAQEACGGTELTFSSLAIGNPTPTVQWQESTDNGTTWLDIEDATSESLALNISSEDNGNQYKAIWTNTVGSVTSDEAALTVKLNPTATLSAASLTICPGENIALELTEASGVSPYTLVVNGITYSNVQIGETFANFNVEEISIWNDSDIPANPSVTDNLPIEVGTKFRSTIEGFITGIRFYKGLTNTGAHTANLWNANGSLLASALFTAETASGWQEVRFATPVPIQANTTYIASYFSQDGFFAIDAGYFASNGQTNGVLTALQSGIDGANGVYRYGGGFPNSGNTANYWVDVLFSQADNNSLVYSLTNIIDAEGCENTGSPVSSVFVTKASLPEGTISPTQTTLCSGSDINLVFESTAGNGPFSLVINGNTYADITSGIPFSVGVANHVPSSNSIWNTSTIGGSQSVDNAPTELGVKIKSSIDGTISGIRFYKTGTEILNFTGSLWTVGNETTPIATANYLSDNTPGWKEIVFATPVPITAGVSYVASYFSPNPNYYAYTANGLAVPFVNSTLTAEASYYKQPGTGYPATSSSANYWVDVIFNSNSSTGNYTLTSITSAAGCSTILDSPITVPGIIIYPSFTPTVSLESNDVDNTFAYGTTVTFTAHADNLGGGIVSYDFKVNGVSVQNGASNTFVVGNLANGNQVSVTISVAGDICLSTTTVNSNVISNVVTGAYLSHITNFCGLTLPAIDSRIKCSIPSGVVGTLGYRFKVRNNATNATATVDSSIANFNLTMTNIYAFGTSYSVQVAAVVNSIEQPYSSVCIITTPSLPTNQLTSLCGQTLEALNTRIYASTVLGTQLYRWRVALTTAPTTYYEYTSVSSSFRLTNVPGLPVSFGKSYLVAVQSDIMVNGSLVTTDYGFECTVSTPPVSVISVSANQCGQTLSNILDRIYINSVPNAVNYTYRVRKFGTASDYDFTTTATSFRLNSFPGLSLTFESQYYVSVSVKIQIDGVTYDSPFSTPCLIGTPEFITVGLKESQCDNGDEENPEPYEVTSSSENIYCEFVSGASYEFLLQKIVGGVPQEAPLSIVRSGNFFNLNMFTGVEAATDYLVFVKLIYYGEGKAGKNCSIRTPSLASKMIQSAFEVKAYPNPFDNSFLVGVSTQSQSSVSVKVYDMLGRLVESYEATSSELATLQIGSRYPSGVYNVIIKQDDEVKTLKVVKR
ncbi:DUF4082 domain-containing protein [Flavobacterium sp. 102]|uniref:DUF4082 domain-containing protein n=1 Tax=Flavobacterium sp. 102 TaxID=2135623 RepID=UPI000EAF72B7|nr:DUF4082 domain-containing protein [Flavobacterium sp. 102]RKS02408.1 putative secreted protein (Por secretion system target) [Flavobacterium sp. 102]